MNAVKHKSEICCFFSGHTTITPATPGWGWSKRLSRCPHGTGNGWDHAVARLHLPLIWKHSDTDNTAAWLKQRATPGSTSRSAVFDKQDAQSDKDATPLWPTLSPQAHPGQPPTLPHFHHHHHPTPTLHLSPPIPLLFRFISVKNNESKHLQVCLHWCSNTQPADSKTHSGIKVKKGRGGEGRGGGLLLLLLLFQWNYEQRRSLGCRAHLLRLWGK